MQAYARLERVRGTSRRGSSRLKLSLDSSLAGSGVDVVIHDLSADGMLVETSASLRKGARLEVELPEAGATLAKVVWNSAEGKRIQTWINGEQMIDYTEPDDSIPQHGQTGLQVHGGGKTEAWYKDITIEELP